jgi:hypothetical protein
MSTRPLALVLSAAAALASSGCLTARGAAVSVPVDVLDGGHVRIWSAYLRAGDDPAVVRGMVAPDLLWRGPIGGHLHIVAFDANGAPRARRAARWSGTLSGRHGASVPFTAPLGVPRADVARLSVSWAPGAHRASEAFE